MAVSNDAVQPNKQISMATKIYEEEWSLINYVRYLRSQLGDGDAAQIQVIIRKDTKDIQILSGQTLKHIVFVAIS